MRAREITLLGQNVNAWNDADDRGLHGLIRELDRIRGFTASAIRPAIPMT